MSPSTRSSGPRRTALALGLAAALLVPAIAAADTGGGGAGGATISIGSISVVGKLIANVTVNVTCDPLATLDPATYQPTTTTVGHVNDLSVALQQAQGRLIDSGQGDLFGNTVVCDGLTINTLVVPVGAQNSPWHSGQALAYASVSINDSFFVSFDRAHTGPVSVKLTSK
jgi:hypothetical protein